MNKDVHKLHRNIIKCLVSRLHSYRASNKAVYVVLRLLYLIYSCTSFCFGDVDVVVPELNSS